MIILNWNSTDYITTNERPKVMLLNHYFLLNRNDFNVPVTN